jgi:type VI secretion system protein ImpL
VQALGATGASEFTLEIDGQALRWRGQPQPWVKMRWPNPTGTPGARISAITPAGATVSLLNESGRDGLKKMIDAARRTRKDNGVFELAWNNGGVTVTANLKIVGTVTPPPVAAVPQSGPNFKRLRLPETIIDATPPAPAATPAPAPAPAAPTTPAAPATPAPAAPAAPARTAGATVGALQ